jgi:hypothetical protein
VSGASFKRIESLLEHYGVLSASVNVARFPAPVDFSFVNETFADDLLSIR